MMNNINKLSIVTLQMTLIHKYMEIGKIDTCVAFHFAGTHWYSSLCTQLCYILFIFYTNETCMMVIPAENISK